MALGASFRQFEKSNGGACKSPLHYRPLSHNPALEIDRLKQVLDEFKGRQKLSGCQLWRHPQLSDELCAAQIISSSHHRTRFVQPDQR